MGADGFRTYAETAYGVKMTEAEAHDTREKFFDTYKGLIPWHKRCVKEAKDFGQVYSPLGRIRHLPQIFSPDNMTRSKEERRAVNSRVQGALSDMSLWATAIMEQEGLTQKAPVILMVHDALYAYVPKDNYLHYMERYKDIMENLPLEKLGWKPKVPFRVDWTLSTGDPEKGIPPNFADLLDASDLKKKKGIAIDIG
jgi:DNA polymerase I-like protein with 3'-5' exonuclease and polymerase domains